MPSCIYCSEPLKCTCDRPDQPTGQTAIGYPKKAKGKLWIHVTDDVGNNVKGVPVSGPSVKDTDPAGLAMFDDLAPQEYTVELRPSQEILKSFAVPEELKKTVSVKDGVLSHVIFMVTRKAHVKIQFVLNSGVNSSGAAPFEDPITVKAVYTETGKQPFETTVTSSGGSADLQLVPPGKYRITPDYSGVNSSEFEYKQETREIDVTADNNNLVAFELARRAKLKVQFAYKHDPNRYLQDKDGLISVQAEFAGNAFQAPGTTTRDTNGGIADFHSVSPGKYKLTPDYTHLCKSAFDFVDETREIDLWPGQEESVTFTVEPLYQQVQFIAHCLLTIPNQVYKPATLEKLDSSQQTGIAGNALPLGEWKDRYHGLADDAKDIQARLKMINYTLKAARTRADNDPATLKIFMIPECFFQGAYGAYLYEDIFGDDYGQQGQASANSKLGLLTELNTIVCDPEWKDWIFSFGTVNCDLTATGSVEMMNYAPVLRGGLGPIPRPANGLKDTHIRLIQKAKNSAELCDRAKLDPDYVEELAMQGGRKPAVNETHQFQGTQNEETIGKYLLALVDDKKNQAAVAKFTEKSSKQGLNPQQGGTDGEYLGIPEELWRDLQGELQNSVNTLGIIRTVRLIRTYDIKDTPPELKDWIYCGYKEEAAWKFEASAYVPTWQQIVYRLIVEMWGPPATKVEKPAAEIVGKLAWKNRLDSNGRRAVLKLVNDDLNDDNGTLFKNLGIELAYQKKTLRAKLQDLLKDDDTAKSFIDDVSEALPNSYKAGKLVIWKKLLTLLDPKKITNLPLTAGPSNLSYRDYCFASMRKAGPFLDLDEAGKLDSCKKLVFGVEICADHAAGQLRYALKSRSSSDPECNIDIQLIPSCGMNPLQENVIARSGGYVFNCDGWIHVTSALRNNDQGGTIEVRFDCPRPKDDKPFYPHSLVGKGGSPAVSLDLKEFKPTVYRLDDSLSANIFGKGAGELHVYDPVPLPK